MAGSVEVARAVEVLHDQRASKRPRWLLGSGFVVRSETVLTAAHNLGDTDGLIAGSTWVRDIEGHEWKVSELLAIDRELDIGAIHVPGLACGLAQIGLGSVGRSTIDIVRDVTSVGFPGYKEAPEKPKVQRRQPAQPFGFIPTAENASGGELILKLEAGQPPPLEAAVSPWAGLSGAGVLVADRLIGVVIEHRLSEGLGSLTVRALGDLESLPARARAEFCISLGVADLEGLPIVNPGRDKVGYPIEELLELPLIDGGPPRVREINPYRLGATPSRYGDQQGREHDPYIPREADEDMHAALRHREFVLVTGPSKAGKSRAAYEAALAVVPDAALLVPRTGVRALPALATDALVLEWTGDLVVWLDDVDRFLVPAEGFDVGLIERFARRTGRTIFLGTLRAERRERLRAGGELDRDTRLVLDAARPEIMLTARLTNDERARASAAYPDEDFDRAGIGELLAATPELLERYRDAGPLEKTLARVAVDLVRIGLLRPIDESELREAAEEYLQFEWPDLEMNDESFDRALEWARHKVGGEHGHVSMLMTYRINGKRAYRPFDYLVDVERREIRDGTRARALILARNESDASAIGITAYADVVNGDASRLEFAIAAFTRAVELTPPDAPYRARALSNLAVGKYELYQRSRVLSDLEGAIVDLERAIALTPVDASDRGRRLSNLGAALYARYEALGESSDLERAIDVFSYAASRQPLNAAGERPSDGELATGELEVAIHAFASGVSLAVPGSAERRRRLTDLGLARLMRYERFGQLDDLDTAIEIFESTLRESTADDQEVGALLHGWGVGLLKRFDRWGDIDDLERAVAALGRSRNDADRTSREFSRRTDAWGQSLRIRYEVDHRPGDLERAIDAFDDAIRTASPTSAEMPAYQARLGEALLASYSHSQQLDDVDRALEMLERAAAATPPSSPDLAARLNDLAGAAFARYSRTHDGDDLLRARDACERAIATTWPSSPRLPSYLHRYACILRALSSLTGTAADTTAADNAFREACVRGLEVSVRIAVRAAGDWGGWATERRAWMTAGEAYRSGLEGVDQLVSVQALRSGKVTWLRDARGLASGASYALALSGDISGAALAAERGRAVLASEGIARDQVDLQRLEAAGGAELAERYRHAATRVATLDRDGDDTDTLAGRHAQMADARTELDAVIRSVRQLPGFEHFLAPPTIATLSTAAALAPVVYLVSAMMGGVALLVHPNDAVQAIELPELSDDSVRAHAERFHTAATDHDRYSREETLNWAWSAAMQPVLNALSGMQRAILIPTGSLGLLPLHAASTIDHRTPTVRRYPLDEVVLTFVPNARTLLMADDIAHSAQSDDLLAVVNTSADLPYTEIEVAAARRWFARSEVLHGAAATKAAVFEGIQRHSVLHFGCHGIHTPTDPDASGLVLADGLLAARDLIAVRPLRARLAVLAAAETALTHIDLLDESISIATGLLEAGVAGVIGSLWAVHDLSTALLLARFYEAWKGDGHPPPEAFGFAQRWLRDSTAGEILDHFGGLVELTKNVRWLDPTERPFADPRFWAAFVYIGA
jgi:CHAT domain-containing protein/tetratricopeptide (TPR) repeat protein